MAASPISIEDRDRRAKEKGSQKYSSVAGNQPKDQDDRQGNADKPQKT
jgi:hypothetical protein